MKLAPALLLLPALASGHEYRLVYPGVDESKAIYRHIDSPLVSQIFQDEFVSQFSSNIYDALQGEGALRFEGDTVGDCEYDDFAVSFGAMTGLDSVDHISITENGGIPPAVRMHDYKAWWSGDYLLEISFGTVSIEVTVEKCDTGDEYTTYMTFQPTADVVLDFNGLTRYTGLSKVTRVDIVDPLELNANGAPEFESLSQYGIPYEELEDFVQELFVQADVEGEIENLLTELILMPDKFPLEASPNQE